MISIIMSYYNQKEYVKEAIESIKNQTFKNYEIIIANASNTELDYFDNLVKEDKRISYFISGDVGAVAARTACIAKSINDFFVILDPDDKIHPEFLEKTFKELSKKSGYGFCYTDSIFYNEVQSQRMMQPDYNFFMLLQQNYICYCSLIRKKAWLDSGGYNKNNFNYFEDYESWIRISAKGHYGLHIPEPLFLHRIHEKSMTSKTDKFGQIYKSFIIRQYPELYHPDLQKEVDKILKEIPSNFMSLRPEQQEKIVESINAR